MTSPRRPFDVLEATLPEQCAQARSLFEDYGESLNFDLCFQGFKEEMKNLPGAYAPPDGRLLLAEWSGKAVGCVALRKLENGVCEMKRLYVNPDARGFGLGRALVEQAISDARAIGYERMRLDTIPSAMHKAIVLYRALGFKAIAPYSSVPIQGAVWMELVL
jgi:GNAT superfamily N-acetyltransferase